MRLLNLRFLQRCGADISADVLQHFDSTMSVITAPVVRRRILKGRHNDVSNVLDFIKVSGVPLKSICRKLIRSSQHKMSTERQLPKDHAILQSLLVELLMQLKIPVLLFQESDVYDIYCARCTGAPHFRTQGSRNDWVKVQAGCEEMYGALRGRMPAKLVAIFKIRDYTCENTVRRVAGGRMLSAANPGFPSDIHGLDTVQMREDAQEFPIVDVGTINGLAHLIPEAERRWLVNSRIDLRRFNEVY